MKLSCEVINDLLPLYVESMSSEETEKLVDEHLKECSKCKKICQEMRIDLMKPIDNTPEPIIRVKRKIKLRQLLIAMLSVVCVAVFAVLGVKILQDSEKIVEYDDNILVEMDDNQIIAELKGSQLKSLNLVRVLDENDEGKDYIFFYMTNTRWDDLIYSSEIHSKITLVSSEKGADDVEKIFYYTGEYENISMMTESEIEALISQSTLLWENNQE